MVEDRPIEVVAWQQAVEEKSMLKVRLSGLSLKLIDKKDVIAILEKCLGFKKDLTNFYKFAEKNETLNTLANRFLGLKPPRFPSVFEAVVNGISCQQVSLDLGIILMNRLATAYGRQTKSSNSVAHAFPTPEDLANLNPDDFRKLGYSRQKGRAIIEISKIIISGGLELEKLENLSNDEALAKLRELRGLGRWTAEYVLLRGLGRLDVFPADDVGARRGLRRLLKIRKILDYSQTEKIVSKWNPYGGFVYFHLLLDSLVQKGVIQI